jgi:hypothetical protein
MTPQLNAPLQHGDKVWTPARTIPGKQHYGIWDGENRAFIHNTIPGGVQYARADQFINGHYVIEKRAAPGYEHEVVRRARAHLGSNYDLLSFNCEHFVNYVADGEKKSLQLQVLMVFAALLGGLAWLLSSGADRPRDSKGRFVQG